MSMKWNHRFLALAQHIAKWSKDPSTQVGAVITDGLNRIIGIGFNGFPRGVQDLPERYLDKPTKYRMVVHAEANAVLNAIYSVSRCAIYTSKFPCTDCVKILIQSGIKAVYTFSPTSEKWIEDAKHSRLMLEEVGIEIHEYD